MAVWMGAWLTWLFYSLLNFSFSIFFSSTRGCLCGLGWDGGRGGKGRGEEREGGGEGGESSLLLVGLYFFSFAVIFYLWRFTLDRIGAVGEGWNDGEG